MDGDSDEPLATTAPRPQTGAATGPPLFEKPAPPKREETKEERFQRFEKREQMVGCLFGICLLAWGGWALVNWVKREYFASAESLADRAVRCFDDVKMHHPAGLGSTEECAKLAERAEALAKREAAEKFCKDKGLNFKGTIGEQVECAP